MMRFGTTVARVPLAARAGITTAHACAWDGMLVYRVMEGAETGIWREDPRGVATPLLLDTRARVHVLPVPCGDVLLVHAFKPGTLLPAPTEILMVRGSRVFTAVPGTAAGANNHGTAAVVVDVPGKVVRHVDPSTGRTLRKVTIQGGVNPMLQPAPSVDDPVTAAVFMDSTQEAGNAHVVAWDLLTGFTSTVMPPQPAPARAAASIQPDGSFIVVECTSSAGPRTRVLHVEGPRVRVLLERQVLSPVVAPEILFPDHALLILADEQGHVDAYALEVSSGTTMRVSHNGRLGGRFHRVDDCVLVEGNAFVGEIPLEPRSALDVQ